MDRVEIGVVSRPHGVRGELRIHLYNADSSALELVSVVYLAGARFEVAQARIVKGGALLRLVGVSDRNQAEAMMGQSLEVLRSELELDEDDLLLDDLVGCEVQRADGSAWGQVIAIMPGMQDIMVIHQGNVERYLPLVDAFLQSVDLDAKLIVVTPPDELPEWDR